MKKLIKKFNFALIGLMASVPAFAAPSGQMTGINEEGLCKLLDELGGLFSTLRTLAFVGAAFIIAGWAWGYISSGKVELKDVQGKGIGMLVGFVLLFSIGTVLTLFMNGTIGGCAVDALKSW